MNAILTRSFVYKLKATIRGRASEDKATVLLLSLPTAQMHTRYR